MSGVPQSAEEFVWLKPALQSSIVYFAVCNRASLWEYTAYEEAVSVYTTGMIYGSEVEQNLSSLASV